jgi:hypothetical protein
MMTMPVIVPAYAALFTLLYIYLAPRVMAVRRRLSVSIGAGGDPLLERRIRVHGNFSEYVPLALLLLGFLEMQGSARWLLHILCLVILAGRVAHAVGVSPVQESLILRAIGVMATLAVLIVASLALLWAGLHGA